MTQADSILDGNTPITDGKGKALKVAGQYVYAEPVPNTSLIKLKVLKGTLPERLRSYFTSINVAIDAILSHNTGLEVVREANLAIQQRREEVKKRDSRRETKK